MSVPLRRCSANRDVPLMHDYDNSVRLSPGPRDIRTEDILAGRRRLRVVLHSRETKSTNLDRAIARWRNGGIDRFAGTARREKGREDLDREVQHELKSRACTLIPDIVAIYMIYIQSSSPSGARTLPREFFTRGRRGLFAATLHARAIR